FSGARIPLYYYQNQEAHKVKGNKQSLGYKKSKADFIYKEHEISISDETTFYLVSDGFTEQIGGAKLLPFGWKRLMNLMKNNQQKNLKEQSAIFRKNLEDYQHNNPQIDDITIIGFKA
ncbi:MAG: SpoIIE family protein phosphatase, partial [Spirochaetes bacterium]|nr:SpoIIE family protein phosphatase [Spirochaetota bacterium]